MPLTDLAVLAAARFLELRTQQESGETKHSRKGSALVLGLPLGSSDCKPSD